MYDHVNNHIKMMTGEALRKHSLHEKTEASVLWLNNHLEESNVSVPFTKPNHSNGEIKCVLTSAE